MRHLITAIFTLFFITLPAYSLGPLDLHFFGGLATPNDQINNVYNRDNIDSESMLSGNFVRDNAELGYHIGINARIELDKSFYFRTGLSYNRFPQSTIRVTDPETQEELVTITTVQNVLPVEAGIIWMPLDIGIGQLYATAGLSYCYISNSTDYTTEEGVSFPLEDDPVDSRVGGYFGAGLDIDLQLLKVNLEGRFFNANLIGKEDAEPVKNFAQVSLGVIL